MIFYKNKWGYRWLNVDKWHKHVSRSYKNCNVVVSHRPKVEADGQNPVQNSKQIRIGFAWAYYIHLLPSVLIND